MACTTVLAIVLAACGSGQTEGDKHRNAISAACMAHGGSAAACACQADTVKGLVDEETYAALANFTQAMAEAESEDTRGMIAMGALTNPKLVLAIERSERAEVLCSS